MIKYRIFSKETVVDSMDEEESIFSLAMLQQQNPTIEYEVEKYNWSHLENRLGRDPDLH
tara:strand:- start:798 stop:974 length:177 start_codon:yes stop_codon:yes gene_type:complete